MSKAGVKHFLMLLYNVLMLLLRNLQCCDFKETANSFQKASALGTDFFFLSREASVFPNDIMPGYSQTQESLVIKAIFRRLSSCRRP